MPRLTHASSGAVVNVSDDTAARLGSEWQPVKAKAAAKADTAEKSTTTRSTTRRSSTSDKS